MHSVTSTTHNVGADSSRSAGRQGFIDTQIRKPQYTPQQITQVPSPPSSGSEDSPPAVVDHRETESPPHQPDLSQQHCNSPDAPRLPSGVASNRFSRRHNPSQRYTQSISSTSNVSKFRKTTRIAPTKTILPGGPVLSSRLLTASQNAVKAYQSAQLGLSTETEAQVGHSFNVVRCVQVG